MQRDDERNTDQENTEEPKPISPPQEIVDASPPEGDVDAGNSAITSEPSAPLDQTAASDGPASSPSASDLSEGESDSEPRLDPPQNEAASNGSPPSSVP